MKDTVQELVVPNALYVMTTSILARIINTCILILKTKPVTSDIFLTLNDSPALSAALHVSSHCIRLQCYCLLIVHESLHGCTQETHSSGPSREKQQVLSEAESGTALEAYNCLAQKEG